MEENKRKKSTKYLLIGTLVLFLSVLGASVAYYLARVSEEFGGSAAGTELAINVEKLSNNATGDLIPLDNDLETLNLAAAGYDNKGACVDINGYSVCQIYHITLTNKGSVPLTVNGTVTLSGQNVPNIDCAKMTNPTTVASNNSCMGGNIFVSGDTLAANSHNDYYVMVYIKNLDEPQYDSGEFNGTVTFTTEDGRKVKGRFTKPFNLAKHIEELYDLNGGTIDNKTAKTIVTNNNIEYNYATNVGLMNDRLGGTTTSLDGGNIRYYGAEPNNYIDIGDTLHEETITQRNWELLDLEFDNEDECKTVWNCKNPDLLSDLNISVEECENGTFDAAVEQELGSSGVHTFNDICKVETKYVREPILWRIIGVFDGKLRIRRDESIGEYSFDTSASDVNDGYGINQWAPSGDYTGSDLMKLLNSGYENNQDLDSSGNTIVVNNSLYWNSGSGKCYNGYDNETTDCDFTNTGLSDEAKEYVIDQTIYLGGIVGNDVFANQAFELERGSNVIKNPIDGITRTLSWTGKVGLIYPSDFGYAADFSDTNCQNTLNSFSSCTANWMNGVSWTVTSSADEYNEKSVSNGVFRGGNSNINYGGWPTLLLDSLVLAESGNGSKSSPYVLTS